MYELSWIDVFLSFFLFFGIKCVGAQNDRLTKNGNSLDLLRLNVKLPAREDVGAIVPYVFNDELFLMKENVSKEH